MTHHLMHLFSRPPSLGGSDRTVNFAVRNRNIFRCQLIQGTVLIDARFLTSFVEVYAPYRMWAQVLMLTIIPLDTSPLINYSKINKIRLIPLTHLTTDRMLYMTEEMFDLKTCLLRYDYDLNLRTPSRLPVAFLQTCR